mmetsp:Transcript_50207/g.92080  ORF Transcript_50207/g.92080 Transcript_50207/m.92080 type:complete len:91 (-) Transcript_50207:412-684(-)
MNFYAITLFACVETDEELQLESPTALDLRKRWLDPLQGGGPGLLLVKEKFAELLELDSLVASDSAGSLLGKYCSPVRTPRPTPGPILPIA